MYCVVLYCAVLYCTVLYFTVHLAISVLLRERVLASLFLSQLILLLLFRDGPSDEIY